jgi:hypothetical protein
LVNSIIQWMANIILQSTFHTRDHRLSICAESEGISRLVGVPLLPDHVAPSVLQEQSMPKQRVEMKVFTVKWICDECGQGEMVPTGIELMSYPAQYPHKCNRCGHGETARGVKYPQTYYEAVEE